MERRTVRLGVPRLAPVVACAAGKAGTAVRSGIKHMARPRCARTVPDAVEVTD